MLVHPRITPDPASRGRLLPAARDRGVARSATPRIRPANRRSTVHAAEEII